MLTSIATVSLSGTLESKLQAVAAAGFDGVEIFENDLLAFPGSAADVGRMIRDLGLICTLYQPFRDFEGMPDDLRPRVFDRAERKFDIMADLQTDLVLVCSNVAPAALGDRDRIIDDFRELGDRAAARSLRIGYEALSWGRYINDHRQAWKIVREADHPAVGIILDSFHSLVRRIPMESLHEIDPDKIFIVQLADAPWLEMDYLSWSRHFRNLPGQGDIPVRAFVSALLEAGYRGPLSLEIFNDRFRASPASMVALDGYRSVRLSMDEAARVSKLDIPGNMPARARCSGFEFIEFAVTEEEGAQLAALLAALGFQETGQHRSKKVSRWQQGDINLVLNSEPEGFPHSHNVVHGPSACALCLRVADVAGLSARAAALSIPTFEGRVGRGEMHIPAVRDVGGGLLYLVDGRAPEEHWARDFLPSASAPTSRTGLTRIDHVTYAMNQQELLSWLLYYFSLLEVDKPAVFETVDPLGLVQSQPVESRARDFRLLLNSSPDSQTLSSRLQARYWGAGIQHMSFQTDDIFVTAETVEALGLEQLPIPRNYYDDLEVRLGIDPDRLERLARHNILYDRDDTGEYFQIFSRAFEKRFFFEIVQREGGYAGYGAANEQIRLAAQARFKDASEAMA